MRIDPRYLALSPGPVRYGRPLAVLACIAILTFILSSYYDVLEVIVGFANEHEVFQLDELITVFLVLVFVLTIYSVGQWRRLVFVNRVIGQKNFELQKAFEEINQLKGILPICASCKRIRDDQGYWHRVEAYVQSHSQAEFSHAICPECMKKMYPNFMDYVDEKPSEVSGEELKNG